MTVTRTVRRWLVNASLAWAALAVAAAAVVVVAAGIGLLVALLPVFVLAELTGDERLRSLREELRKRETKTRPDTRRAA